MTCAVNWIIVRERRTESTSLSHPDLAGSSLFTVYLKGNERPKNFGCAVLSENAKIVANWPSKTLINLERRRGFQPGGVLS